MKKFEDNKCVECLNSELIRIKSFIILNKDEVKFCRFNINFYIK